jgi:hypothetical protein
MLITSMNRQGVAIAFMDYFGFFHQVGAWSVENITKGLQDFLICVEMFVVSVAHVKIFGYEEFRNPNKEAFLRLIFSGRIKYCLLSIFSSLSSSSSI